MAKKANAIDVYIEAGKTKTFAAALDWPGWCRSARDEDSALQTLFDYAPRYARAIASARVGFDAPSDLSALKVSVRQKGDATTDFGAISLAIPADTEPVESDELKRWQKILKACWRMFDDAAESAQGKSLRKGPRGGGRELEKIAGHVRDVDAAYLNALGGKLKRDKNLSPEEAIAQLRDAILMTLEASVRGEIPSHGPRGGERWTPRYFVRRLAWHILDHAWEIEDRVE
jgi:hypothetical protein